MALSPIVPIGTQPAPIRAIADPRPIDVAADPVREAGEPELPPVPDPPPPFDLDRIARRVYPRAANAASSVFGIVATPIVRRAVVESSLAVAPAVPVAARGSVRVFDLWVWGSATATTDEILRGRFIDIRA